MLIACIYALRKNTFWISFRPARQYLDLRPNTKTARSLACPVISTLSAQPRQMDSSLHILRQRAL